MTQENQSNIVRVLLYIGLRNKGYLYFCETLHLMLEERNSDPKYTLIYERVGAKLGRGLGAVERSMRNSIESAYNDGKLFNLNTLYQSEVITDKPSVSDLLQLLYSYFTVLDRPNEVGTA